MSDKKPEQSQIDKFRDLARELEADDDEARFEDALRRIANAPNEKPKAPDEG